MQPALTTDREADERIANYNKVHLALIGSAKTTHQLVLDTGLSANDVSSAIHYLSKQRMAESVWSDTLSTKLHTLTDAGRMFSPAPPKPDFKAPECDPRVAPKNSPHFTGTRHFEGIVGKYPIDHDGNIILDPARTKGKIYFAMEGQAMTAADIIAKTALPDQVVWNHMGELVKMKLVTYEVVGKTRIYEHATDCKAVRPATPNAPAPAAKLAAPVLSAVPSLPPDAKKVPVVTAEPSIDLTPAIRMLLKTYSLTDIALALFAEAESEINELKKWKADTEALFANLKLGR